MSKNKQVITITFGDVAENHQGMQNIGQMNQKGFSYQELLHAAKFFQQKELKYELVELHKLIDKKDIPKGLTLKQAYILVVTKGLNHILPENKDIWSLHKQLRMFEWDTKYFDTRRQKVLNKLARHNVCFNDNYQAPDYANKKGTIIPWKNVPILYHVKQQLNQIMGTNVNFVAEGNLYYDGGVKTTGLGYHGDAERKMVIAIRTGNNTMPLHYQWYYNSKPIGKNFSVDICPGDFYVMSQKAVGTDWKKKSILTIRHASGAAKYVKV